MSADPIDDLAEALFTSARGERASERLVQRVLSDVASADQRRAQVYRRSSPPRVRAKRPLTGVLLAAAACVVAGIAWSTIEPPRQAPPISAEVAPRREHGPVTAEHVDTSARPAPATTPAVEVEPLPIEPQSAQHGEARQVPSAPPRRATSQRAPRVAPSPSRALPPEATAPEPVPEPPAPGTTGAVELGVDDAADTAAARPSLSDELQALERARAALRGGDGRAALRLLDGGGTAAGFTRLAAEATLLRIEALYAVGELAESRRLADEFTTHNPDSHLGDRARSFIRRVDASRNATGGSAPR